MLAAFLGTMAGDPVLAVGRETAARDDAVQMRVMNQLLAPGVEDGEEADLGTQVFGISSDRAESSGRGLEQQVVNHYLVLQGQAGDGLGQGKDDVKIDDGQELLLTGSDPAGFGQGLALRAMAIATGVVGGRW